MDLVNELEKMQDQLKKSLKKLRLNGIEQAKCEKEYKIAVNKKALELKADGMPVTLIQQVIYGYEDIAELRFKRDSAEVIYNANQEAINCLKLQMRLIEEQIKREQGFND